MLLQHFSAAAGQHSGHRVAAAAVCGADVSSCAVQLVPQQELGQLAAGTSSR